MLKGCKGGEKAKGIQKSETLSYICDIQKEMAINKKQAFLPQEQAVSAIGKAFAHPARLAILKVLAEKGGCICGELVDALPLAQSTVSQHLKELKDAGLVLATLDGPRSCYCINWPALQSGMEGIRLFYEELQYKQAITPCQA